MAAARRHTAARSPNDFWPHDSNVFCACARSCMACSSVRSSKAANTLLSNGLTVWYPMGFRLFGLRRLRATATADLGLQAACERCCPAERERADIASDLAPTAGVSVVAEDLLTRKSGREAVLDKQRHQLSVAFAFLRLTGTRTSRMWPQRANSSRRASVGDDHALARVASRR